MFGNQPNEIKGWTCVYQTGTDYDAELVKGYLESRDIQCTILNKRDHAYNLTVGDMAKVWIYVPDDMVNAAHLALADWSNAEMDVDDFE